MSHPVLTERILFFIFLHLLFLRLQLKRFYKVLMCNFRCFFYGTGITIPGRICSIFFNVYIPINPLPVVSNQVVALCG